MGDYAPRECRRHLKNPQLWNSFYRYRLRADRRHDACDQHEGHNGEDTITMLTPTSMELRHLTDGQGKKPLESPVSERETGLGREAGPSPCGHNAEIPLGGPEMCWANKQGREGCFVQGELQTNRCSWTNILKASLHITVQPAARTQDCHKCIRSRPESMMLQVCEMFADVKCMTKGTRVCLIAKDDTCAPHLQASCAFFFPWEPH